MSTPDNDPICAGSERAQPQLEARRCHPNCSFYLDCIEAQKKIDKTPDQLEEIMRNGGLRARIIYGGNDGYKEIVERRVAEREGIRPEEATKLVESLCVRRRLKRLNP